MTLIMTMKPQTSHHSYHTGFLLGTVINFDQQFFYIAKAKPDTENFASLGYFKIIGEGNLPVLKELRGY